MAPLRIRLARQPKRPRANLDKPVRPPPPPPRAPLTNSAPTPSQLPPIHTRSSCPDTREAHRWSDIVPPHTALTFIAMYDPDEGLIAFSGSALLPLDIPDLPADSDAASTASAASSASSASSKSDDTARSQVLTLDPRGAAAPTPAPSTGQMTSHTAMRDMQTLLRAYFRGGREGRGSEAGETEAEEEDAAGGARPTRMPEARVSSTLEGLYCNTAVARPRTPTGRNEDEDGDGDDDTLRRSPGKLSRNDSGYASDEGEEAGRIVRTAGSDEFDSFFALYDDRSVYDPNEISAFSVTTTSTSSYIGVDLPSLSSSPSTSPSSDAHSTFWSTLEAPELASLNVLAYASGPPHRKRATSFHHAKRLFKTRSFPHDAPAKPAKVLARADYNYCDNYDYDGAPPHHGHHGCRSAPPASPARVRRALSKRWMRLTGGAGAGAGADAGWVCVEVEHRVTQRDLREDLSL
ncbi:hypothetical protein OF83DRAFT_1178711 [Amylostereum chailletii]|nr:hypothetical protein OF83DRAFT_1178711 [Amylostereum chailletii]